MKASATTPYSYVVRDSSSGEAGPGKLSAQKRKPCVRRSGGRGKSNPGIEHSGNPVVDAHCYVQYKTPVQ